MTQDRRILDKVWDLTRDLSFKVSRKVEKHWKINTLRVEIASLKQRRNAQFKDLGRFVYKALAGGLKEEAEYKNTLQSFFNEIKELDEGMAEREARIALIEEEFQEPEMPPSVSVAPTANIPEPPQPESEATGAVVSEPAPLPEAVPQGAKHPARRAAPRKKSAGSFANDEEPSQAGTEVSRPARPRSARPKTKSPKPGSEQI